MKNSKNWRILFVLLIALTTFQSCYKDDFFQGDPNSDNQSFEDDFVNDDDFDNDDDFNDDSTSSNDNDATDTNTNEDFDSGASGDEGEITQYIVSGNDIVKVKDFAVSGEALEFQQDVAKHQEIWELTKKLIPSSYLAKMSHFMIFAGEETGTAGYVYETSADLSTWEMGIAIDFAYEGGGLNADGELAYTIIHEFGHILTLDNTQLDSSISEDSCQNYFPGEGCAKTEAYINKLHTRYWADIENEHANIGQNQNLSDDFYDKYQDRFVTNYASTNPAEDIAEVFATFVTRSGGVNGNSIAEQKIQLMYDHSELIGFRDFVRENSAVAKGSRALQIASSWKNAKIYGNEKHSGCVRHSR